jgi:DNA-binding MarR family transcriptional regulator
MVDVSSIPDYTLVMENVRWLSDREERAWRSLQFMQMRLEGELARQLAADSGLSYPDYLVLVALTGRDDGRMRLFELAATLGWEKSRASHHVGRMVARGLVKKEKCDSDRRGADVVVTARGRREIAAAAPGHVATVRRLFVDRLTPEQLDAVAEAAETVFATLESASVDHDARVKNGER